MRAVRLVLGLVAALTLLAASGCAQTSRAGIAAPPRALTIATTVPVLTTDPVAAVDQGSQSLVLNVFQRLMTVQTGNNVVKPDAANDCLFIGELTYSCDLRGGMTFSNGDPVRSTDVKFSIERARRMKVAGNSAAGLRSIARIDTPSASRVDFVLRHRDNNLGYALASPAASIVNSRLYSPTEVWPSTKLPVGSGSYDLASRSLDELYLVQHADYKGAWGARTSPILLKMFSTPDALQRALATGSVDVGWRIGPPPAGSGYRPASLSGAGMSRLVWQPGSDLRVDPAVRERVRSALDGVRTTNSLVPHSVVSATDTLPSGPGGSAPATSPLQLRVAVRPLGQDPSAAQIATKAIGALKQAQITVHEVDRAEDADVVITSESPWTSTLLAWLQPWWEFPLPDRQEQVTELTEDYRTTVDNKELTAKGRQLLQAATQDGVIVPLGEYDLTWFTAAGVSVDQSYHNWLGSGYQLGCWGWARETSEEDDQ